VINALPLDRDARALPRGTFGIVRNVLHDHDAVQLHLGTLEMNGVAVSASRVKCGPDLTGYLVHTVATWHGMELHVY
jgi:hypothetical protein